ncbi:hypothetical protein BU24DRAFT_452911 [Aaosphaeria arxii CBS 175.79]|uniref:Fatty acid hydroxylase domain-containing protein n=1 Tax=Aaosphaeria arxii CBS 175.79 TaxID=1450172 RepID=A0A6A5XHZ7_9PLEO|nr:uncharacterized protein BU24DRAFT_452911 [Aaosphaeria arxii CBS 175.79]KAF2012496.1 hypothetical protein BU24DRAFT_452911 [Aaosphaeria arxii CBS 175.79]
MDIVLEAFDTYAFDHLYAALAPVKQYPLGANATFSSAPKTLPTNNWQFEPASEYLSFTPGPNAYLSQLTRDDWRRQLVTLFIITWVFGLIVYYVFASLSYFFIFDKATFNHPKYLKNQISLEIKQANAALPVMAIPTAFCFLFEVRGWSKMYDSTAEGPGMWYNIIQFPFFILFTDFLVYWIHRYLHHPLIYKHLHKPHHKWIMPTPYASHAFHPMDGFAQSIPYHLFPFLFPLQKFAYIALFVFVNIWSIMIHDGEYYAENPIINGAACHTMHHLYFNFNYGQYTTLWDRLGGSYRKPNDELFRKELKMCQSEWKKQSKEMEKIAKEVEGDDEREYIQDEPKKVK